MKIPHHSAALVAAVFGTALLAAPAMAGDTALGRDKAKACAACHGIDGVAKMPHVPNIAGESTIYLEKQLKAFRSGERHDPMMSIIAEGLSDDDIANVSAWYAAIKVEVTLPE